ncbi:MAG: MFS transporter, partial [Burkholderiaceae bacterium]
YVLVYGSLMLGFGALGDRFGYLRMFRAGLVLSVLAFSVCALAPSYGGLLAGRALQGVAVALTVSCAPALATLLVDEARRTRALGAFAATQALAAVVAPVLGGVLVETFGWPGVFGFRVPIALLALLGLPALAPAAARQRLRVDGSYDARGSALLAAGVSMLLLAPSLLGPGGSMPGALLAAGCGVVAITVFVRRERRAAVPFLPASVARDVRFRLLNTASCVIQAAGFAVPLLLPYNLLRNGWTAVESGGPLAVWALGSLAGSAIAARVVLRLGAHQATWVAAVLAGVGLAGIATWPAVPDLPSMLPWLVLQGLGMGLFQVAYTDAVIAALPISSRGVAGGLSMVARTVGVVVGATVWMGMVQAFERGDGGFGTIHALAAAAAGVAAAMIAFSRYGTGR